jgi:hypothetical protein
LRRSFPQRPSFAATVACHQTVTHLYRRKLRVLLTGPKEQCRRFGRPPAANGVITTCSGTRQIQQKALRHRGTEGRRPSNGEPKPGQGNRSAACLPEEMEPRYKGGSQVGLIDEAHHTQIPIAGPGGQRCLGTRKLRTPSPLNPILLDGPDRLPPSHARAVDRPT